ncbi:hypothetical protein [Myroides sp. TSA_177.3]|uniref:hypothetical protein n=1 Tax=Myroides sp. TSA_177.3 TaxID=3415650 RepID=UPI004046577C
MKQKKWKIIQTHPTEYILLSDSNSIKKITGKDTSDIITVLRLAQEQLPIPPYLPLSDTSILQQNRVEELRSWLTLHQFITTDTKLNTPLYLDIIGEFGTDLTLLHTFIAGLPEQIKVSTIYNLSLEEQPKFQISEHPVALTLLVGPYFYNTTTIRHISAWQQMSSSDFLFVELYENGLLLGPLMNSRKGTVCLNCIEARKVFNTTASAVFIDHFWDIERIKDHAIPVWEIGTFSIATSFIYNELYKIMVQCDKALYNKAIFLDFNRYHNQYFTVLSSPSCEFCMNLSIYNAL